ncbi:MAG: Phospho-N-acetylmuramoyl-pentapeptide-transferase, partial [Candidatus Collierbacteria bacterium GW2011_GWB2_42_12]
MDLLLGILIFSFIVHAFAIVPFVNFLYHLKFFKNKTAISKDKIDEASVHIRSKSRTPEGGGLLIIVITSLIFAFALPLLRSLGFEITHVYPINDEINIIFFTFISFGLLGLYDDIVKFFELDREEGYTGLKTRYKLLIQVALGLIIGAMMYLNLGIDIIHIPFFGVIHFGLWFIPLAAFLVVTFANSVNITDGMDGLASGLLMISLFGF